MDRKRAGGFTLIELILVIVIGGILVTVALRQAGPITRDVQIEESRREMEKLAFAIAGNPNLHNGGVRADYGYVGDIGALPPDLDALRSNPGGYATWRGPYIENAFAQAPADFKQDAWGAGYVMNGVSLSSVGGGDTISIRLAGAIDQLVRNTVSGNIYDHDGIAPGAVYRDSLRALLTIPDGAGGLMTRTRIPDGGGYFVFDSIPIGNHLLCLVYLPQNDTLRRTISVGPGSHPHGEYHLAGQFAAPGMSAPEFVPGSDSVSGSPPCTDLTLWVKNASAAPITLTSIRLTWTSPPAYFATISWDGTDVFDLDGTPRGESGLTYPFSAPQTMAAGQQVRVRILDFRTNNTTGGGAGVSMSNVSLTITLSNGATFVEGFPTCP